MPAKKTPESYVLRAVTDLLTAERVWWMRCQSGMQVLEHHGRKRAFRAGRPGMADILALPEVAHCSQCEMPFRRKNGTRWSDCCTATAHHAVRPLWIECKAPAGRQSSAQAGFQVEVELHDHAYLLVRSVEEVIEWLKTNR